VISFLATNYEYIILVVLGTAGLFLIGKKRAINMVLAVFEEAKEELFNTIEQDYEKYAEYIYDKLPKTAKIFVTKTMVSQIIIGIMDLVEEKSDLDKK